MKRCIVSVWRNSYPGTTSTALLQHKMQRNPTASQSKSILKNLNNLLSISHSFYSSLWRPKHLPKKWGKSLKFEKLPSLGSAFSHDWFQSCTITRQIWDLLTVPYLRKKQVRSTWHHFQALWLATCWSHKWFPFDQKLSIADLFDNP